MLPRSLRTRGSALGAAAALFVAMLASLPPVSSPIAAAIGSPTTTPTGIPIGSPTATPTGIPIETPTKVPSPVTVVGACPSQATTPKSSATPTATATPLPSGQFALSQFVVLSCTSTTLASGVKSLDAGKIGANDVRVKGSSAEVRVGPSSQIVGDVIGNRLQLQTQASVQNIFYNALSNAKLKPATVGGSQNHPLPLPLVNFPSFPTFTPGTDDVTIAPGTSASLWPDRYGRVKVQSGASLFLFGGNIQMISLTVESGAQAVVDSFFGQATITVEEKISVSKGASIGAAGGSGLPAHRLVFYVAGVNSRTGRPFPSSTSLVSLGPSTSAIGNFYAPTGKIQIGTNSQATGAFIADQISVLSGAQLHLDSAF